MGIISSVRLQQKLAEWKTEAEREAEYAFYEDLKADAKDCEKEMQEVEV